MQRLGSDKSERTSPNDQKKDGERDKTKDGSGAGIADSITGKESKSLTLNDEGK